MPTTTTAARRHTSNTDAPAARARWADRRGLGDQRLFTYDRGVFVNLYLPSRLSLAQNGRALTLRRATAYPLDVHDRHHASAPRRRRLSRSRCASRPGPAPAPRSAQRQAPASSRWSPARSMTAARAGATAIVSRCSSTRRCGWRAVDEQHPDLLAVMQGPLALFALGDRFLPFTRPSCCRYGRSRPVRANGACHRRRHAGFKPYYALGFETTRLYQPVVCASSLPEGDVERHDRGQHDQAQHHVRACPSLRGSPPSPPALAPYQVNSVRSGCGRAGQQADDDHQRRRHHQQHLRVVEPVDVPELEDPAMRGPDRRDRGVVLLRA